MAKEAGYQDIKDVLKEGKSLKAGDKVYAVCMEKMLAMFRMGEEPLSNGMNVKEWLIWIHITMVESKNTSG